MNNGYFGYPYNVGQIMPLARTSGLRNSLASLFGARGVAPIATSGVTSRLSLSSILNGASKTLGFVNQAIPVVNQIRPIWNNAKTMLKMSKLMNNDKPIKNTTISNSKTNATNIVNTKDISLSEDKEEYKKNSLDNNGPTFFV